MKGVFGGGGGVNGGGGGFFVGGWGGGGGVCWGGGEKKLNEVMAHWHNQSAHLICRSELKEKTGLFQNKQLRAIQE